jgi:hypothetical protein
MRIGFSTQLSRGPRIGTLDIAGAFYRPQGFRPVSAPGALAPPRHRYQPRDVGCVPIQTQREVIAADLMTEDAVQGRGQDRPAGGGHEFARPCRPAFGDHQCCKLLGRSARASRTGPATITMRSNGSCGILCDSNNSPLDSRLRLRSSIPRRSSLFESNQRRLCGDFAITFNNRAKVHIDFGPRCGANRSPSAVRLHIDWTGISSTGSSRLCRRNGGFLEGPTSA